LLRIDTAIQNGSFFNNEAIKKMMSEVASQKSSLHLMGLVSDGGVHSQLSHLFALLDMAKAMGIVKVYVQAILDGRDTPPNSGIRFIETLKKYMDKREFGKIASICGRYYAMDRDKRWERIQKAYLLYTKGDGVKETDPVQATRTAYAKGETDEFIKPVTLVDEEKNSPGLISDHDAILFFNFRADRAREITRAFTDSVFVEFERNPRPDLCAYLCMTLYDESFNLPVAFEPVHLKNILGEVVSTKGLKQLRIAETEKYAHVTYFFNGGEEKPFQGEDRCLIPSPKDVATYDLKPEMSAFKVTQEVIKRIKSDKYDLIVLNFANMDMVGHTGVMAAAVKACETVDQCVGKIVTLTREKKWAALVTADHGNAEKMIDEDGRPYTAHTVGEVNFFLVDESRSKNQLRKGSLCDIAPTMLEIMDIEQPKEMTGRSLLSGE
jgi:2,3-bisphosphoglycerate-independent phosphoglycerate mutase